jgi:NodT family efflux transporter outer membrane factor (OMF) lipoprotein
VAFRFAFLLRRCDPGFQDGTTLEKRADPSGDRRTCARMLDMAERFGSRAPRNGFRGILVPARWLAAPLILGVLLSGCTPTKEYIRNGFKVGPNYRQPPAAVASQWIEHDEARVGTAATDLSTWWTVFNDPVLNTLIGDAYQRNLDLRIAAAHVLEATAQRNVAVGNLLPQSQKALGAYAHIQLPKNLGLPLTGLSNVWVPGFNASWELDFWGRYRRAVESTNATLEANVADYNNALVTLFGDLATSYVNLRLAQRRLELLRRNVEIQEEVLEVSEARFKKGATTELDVQQGRLNVAQTESSMPPLRVTLQQQSNQLCLLLGIPPQELGFTDGPIPVAPAEVAAGIPADLLRRRPDIRQAERQVAAQSAQIGIAESDLYPRFSLIGFVGYGANQFSRLFAANGFLGLIAPTFQWNILNYGRICNNIRTEQARFTAEVLSYQKTVLQAGQEAEDTLVAFLQAQEQAKRLGESVAAAERSVALVVAQYKAGTVDFNRVYTNQAALVTQQDQLAIAEANIALNLVALYRALGGGWPVTGPGCAPVVPPPRPTQDGAGGLPPPTPHTSPVSNWREGSLFRMALNEG